MHLLLWYWQIIACFIQYYFYHCNKLNQFTSKKDSFMKQKLQNLFFLFLLGTIGANAQGPVITAAGVNPVIGESFKVIFANANSVNAPDTGGANRVWDYSSLQDSAYATISVVSPKGLLFADSFPSSDLALQIAIDTIREIEYDQANTTSWGFLGLVSYINVNDTNSMEVDIYNPKQNEIVYPMSYKKLYTDSLIYQDYFYTDGNLTDYDPSNLQYDTLFADGYGTLKLPNATYTNVLREYSGQGYDGNGEYDFYVNGVHWPVLVLNSYVDSAYNAYWMAYYYGGAILPIEISSFTASWKDKLPYLQWEAANTENTKQFNIQRSADGRGFATVGQVGVSGGASYHFVDNDIPTGTIYYRLQQVDKNGQTFYSNTARLTVNGQLLTVYPNPTKETIHVSLKSGNQAQVLIYDVAGKLVYENKSYTSAAAIATDSWGKGTYLVRIKDNDGWKTGSFEKE